MAAPMPKRTTLAIDATMLAPCGPVPERVHDGGKYYGPESVTAEEVAQASGPEQLAPLARAGSIVGGGPGGRLRQSLPEEPRYQGDDEQVSEDYPDTEQPVRREHEREHQGDDRAQAPSDLGKPHQLATCPGRSQLSDEGKRGGHVGADGDPHDDGSDEE